MHVAFAHVPRPPLLWCFYTPAEFAKKRAAGNHFLTRVLDKPKLFVLGDEDELEKIAG